MLASLLALALALATTSDAVGPGGADPRAQQASDLPGEHGRDQRGWRQALALGWQGETFWSNEGSHYTFHSLSFGYLGSFGPRGIFLHVNGLVPLQARQDARVVAVSGFYGSRMGGDVLVGWQWRWLLARGLEVEAGPGAHLCYLALGGRSGYRDFSALPMGVGAMGVLRYSLDAQLRSWPVDVGAYGSMAVDGYDPLRADDLKHGYAFRAGLLVGLRPH
jgi:hypothetical protein